MSRSASSSRRLWSYWLPRIVHDVASFWSVVFWLWVIADAFAEARREDLRVESAHAG